MRSRDVYITFLLWERNHLLMLTWKLKNVELFCCRVFSHQVFQGHLMGVGLSTKLGLARICMVVRLLSWSLNHELSPDLDDGPEVQTEEQVKGEVRYTPTNCCLESNEIMTRWAVWSFQISHVILWRLSVLSHIMYMHNQIESKPGTKEDDGFVFIVYSL